MFFGRGAETEELAELLRSPAERSKAAVLLVVGPSGCGKSSLVRAGLLHVMAQEPGWQTLLPILPGADLVAALARELAVTARRSGLDWTVDHVHHRLRSANLARLTDPVWVNRGGGEPGGPAGRRYRQELGKVQGALTRQADVALTEASAATGRRPEEVIAGLLRLVTVDEQGRPVRWRAPATGCPSR